MVAEPSDGSGIMLLRRRKAPVAVDTTQQPHSNNSDERGLVVATNNSKNDCIQRNPLGPEGESTSIVNMNEERNELYWKFLLVAFIVMVGTAAAAVFLSVGIITSLDRQQTTFERLADALADSVGTLFHSSARTPKYSSVCRPTVLKHKREIS